MNRPEVARERALWIAVTAVLATSLAWLAVVSLALAAGSCTGRCAGALAVLRALSRAALAVGRLGGPAALAALAAAVVLLAAVMHEGRARRGGHHA